MSRIVDISFRSAFSTIAFISIFLLHPGCKTVPVKREIKEVREISALDPSGKFIKAHMKNGMAYVMFKWHFDSHDSTLNGYGSVLDLNRNVIEKRGDIRSRQQPTGPMFKVDLSDIALIETNDPGPSIAGGLAVVTGITSGFAIFCLLNPKACFGSCPTFYAMNGDSMVLQAEGFSTSISPSLEKNDIDMLYAITADRSVELKLTNEAMETHAIRYARLLAFEKREEGERIFAAADGTFLRATGMSAPLRCQSSSRDCLQKVYAADGLEYFSSADSTNLNSREEVIITFDVKSDRPVGLVVGKRQTLMTTYLMYQGLAYMGNAATYWMAEMERGKGMPSKSIFSLLGGVEVFSQDPDGNWTFEGELNETGPIATDFNVMPLSRSADGTITLKLRMNKGLWRIDYLALATLAGEVQPVIIEPAGVETITGSEPEPLKKLRDENAYLITYPGDIYLIRYDVPFVNAELFLDSRGYYLEWIRDEWVKEQSFSKLALMINRPSQFLKRTARAFKKIEPVMEETFWNSRYVKK